MLGLSLRSIKAKPLGNSEKNVIPFRRHYKHTTPFADMTSLHLYLVGPANAMLPNFARVLKESETFIYLFILSYITSKKNGRPKTSPVVAPASDSHETRAVVTFRGPHMAARRLTKHPCYATGLSLATWRARPYPSPRTPTHPTARLHP